jgi:DNA helicase-2/ATP-dependent DNA helicase PcrA
MELIVDLHIHSHHSRATSKNMDLESLYRWGKIKGINVIGTGDFTHPGWFAELREKLEPAEQGLYKLREDLAAQQEKQIPERLRNNLIRFILTSEISNIYSKGGNVRKLHNVIISPSLEVVAEINAHLSQIGNLKADGRPILGMDSKELLRLAVETSAENLFIPAHIWTPWFAMFGSKSGFDTVDEAFEDLTHHITVVETGLSSDPFMNWRLSQLDRMTLVSNSDAHSPAKLGREANVVNCDLDYASIIGAIRSGDERMVGTIEFFPQEGKYHYDGHRSCNVVLHPDESRKLNNICPVCGQPLVLGVDHRVADLADRPEDYRPGKHKRVEYIIPLAEMVAEIFETKSTSSKKVDEEYHRLIDKLGDEFSLLRNVPIEDIAGAGFTQMAEAIRRLRQGAVHLQPGYDGVYGVVKVFKPGEKPVDRKQGSLF